jgi:prepilin-type N-terminal cleavage/methylation domain-containing protein
MQKHRYGFTLIELSIVLVILGLMTAGILAGKELIITAKLRAQIKQLESYNSAMRTFQSKYSCLPGDCVKAANFGFVARGTGRGQGDGDGIMEGYSVWFGTNGAGLFETAGENSVFWRDLSQAKLIPNGFSTADNNDYAGVGYASPRNYLPAGKIDGIYTYVWSYNNINYFGLSGVSGMGWSVPISVPGLRAIDAYGIDSKIDDGLPQSGRATAQYVNYAPDGGGMGNLLPIWAKGGTDTIPSTGEPFGNDVGVDPATAESPSALTCYDNGNNASATMRYTMNQNSQNANCALSLRWQ